MHSEFYLTGFEYDLACNAEIMHAKNRVIQKVIGLFAVLSESYVSIANTSLPPSLIANSPKISRGEQYLSLPYAMLDYPRIFGKDDTFAIRTFFWWGNHFSIHLHLSGMHKQTYQPKFEKAIKQAKLEDWFWCINHNEWQHHFEVDNYVSIQSGFRLSKDEPPNFIKIAKKIPLHEWNSSAEKLVESFRLLTSIIAG